MLRTLVVVAALCMTTACTTGKDFNKPSPDSLVLGKTTRSDVVAIYGKPGSEATTTIASGEVKAATDNGSAMNPAPVEGSFNRILYSYQDRSGRLTGGGTNNKTLFFNFWNGTLVAYNFMSDFVDDSSNFDESKLGNLRKGMTTRDQAIAIIGIPSGRSTYPIVKQSGDEKFLYSYVYTKDGQIHKKSLELLFNSSLILTDYRLIEDSTPAPVYAAPVSTPIFIPTHK